MEDNPWSTMEMDMRSNNLKTFTGLQTHFTKQLVGKGMDPREAREQAGDSIMCFVVANFSDMMLRDMISRSVLYMDIYFQILSVPYPLKDVCPNSVCLLPRIRVSLSFLSVY